MRNNNHKNYREYYKSYFNIKFGNNMEVHHIDMNRDNNDISNLLLLPKDIHQKYHRIESFFNNIKIGSNKFFDFSTSPYVIMFTEKHNILEISNVIYYFSDLKTQQQHEILLAKKNKRNPIMFYQHEI